MSAFSSLLLAQSISCWQVWRRMSNKKKTWVLFLPPPLRSSPLSLSLSINSCIPSLQCPLEIALFSLLKAVLSVNSKDAAKRAEDFSGVAESDRMELWARPGRARLSSGLDTGQRGRRDKWGKSDNATIALLTVKLFSFRSPSVHLLCGRPFPAPCEMRARYGSR